MKHRLVQAAEDLLSVLELENAALEAMDLAGAAALLGRKDAAGEVFAAAVSAVAPLPMMLAERLRAAAARNQVLLERGIAVQGRVLAIVAGATRAAVAGPSRYGAAGLAAVTGRRDAVAISVRA